MEKNGKPHLKDVMFISTSFMKVLYEIGKLNPVLSHAESP